MSAFELARITVYPVKSTAGCDVDSARVEPRGLEHDRRLMLIAPDGTFITGREQPLLTQVRAQVVGRTLGLEGPGMERIEIALAEDGAHPEPVDIRGEACTGAALDGRAGGWFERLLGTPCRLVQMTRSCVRPTREDFALPGDEVSYADGFPLLLVSSASLEDLNARLAEPVSVRRFRANLVVDGGDPFVEDGWTRVRIGEVLFDAVKRCDRCVFTTIDPETGERHPQGEPLRTLSRYRRTEEGILFGQNLTPRGAGVVRVGDPVAVLE